MIKQLLEEIFQKLLLEVENNNKTINGCFVFFVNEVLEKRFNSPNLIGERTMIDYYKKHVEGKHNNSKEPSHELKNYMANYLGYVDFSGFEISKKKNTATSIRNKDNYTKRKLKFIPIIFLITIFLGFFYFYNSTNKNCIKWEDDHYIEINCNFIKTEEIELNNKNINIEQFKKLEITRSTVFFNAYKNPIVWYGKINSKIDFFNTRGIHPITKKELKPVTKYILDKYVIFEKE
jgi:hypothetical protein